MSVELAVFATFALLAVVSSLVVITHRNPVYSVMSLVVTFVSVAALFVLLGAPFLAALQILVYTGAILVLFLFVIMLLNVGREIPRGGRPTQRWVAVFSAFAFAGILGVLLWSSASADPAAAVTRESVALRPLAAQILGPYLLPFELVGLLLLAAVIAATVLARRPRRKGDSR